MKRNTTNSLVIDGEVVATGLQRHAGGKDKLHELEAVSDEASLELNNG